MAKQKKYPVGHLKYGNQDTLTKKEYDNIAFKNKSIDKIKSNSPKRIISSDGEFGTIFLSKKPKVKA